MINETVKGDLLKMAKNGDFDIIIHGCNCRNTMGAGIAFGVKRFFPEAYMADKATKYGDRSKLGTYTTAMSNGVLVVNAYTQFDYRGKKPVDYDAIRSCFRQMNTDSRVVGKRIGIPLIGCGLAGGRWSKVSRIINEETPNLDITLVEYNK